MAENEKKEKQKKIGFFKKLKYSITKFEKYPEMAAEGMPNAFSYLAKIMLIFSIIVSISFLFEIHQLLQDKTRFNEYINSVGLAENTKIEVLENQLKVTMNNNEVLYSFNEIYVVSFFIIYVYSFALYSVSALVDVLLITALGKISILFTKIKIKFSELYSMSIYALTLSIILNAIYIPINVVTGFEISFFYIMYISVAYVCLVAALFMIKIDYMKRQEEVAKIKEEQQNVKQEIEKQNEEEDKNENKKPKDEDNNEDENEDNDKEEPSGSEA